MKLDNIYNLGVYKRKEAKQDNTGRNSYSFAGKGSLINAASGLFTESKANRTITYNHASKIIKTIEGLLGQEGYITEKMKKAGLSLSADQLIVKNKSVLSYLLSTLKYPFVEMPFNILRGVCKWLDKTPLNSLSQRILNNGVVKRNLAKIDKERDYELVKKIFGQFCANGTDSFDTLNEKFTQKTLDKITSTVKNYASRDERTLNRITTATVGAVLSARDMYNISMLEKDNKNTAKKAEKDRLEQELSRVGISAALTFMVLGTLDRRNSKNSLIKSSLLIAGATLFAEVVSRLIKKKSLVPLTPEKAAKIAEKQEEEQKEKQLIEKGLLTSNAMEQLRKKDKNNLFASFTKSDKTLSAPAKSVTFKADKHETTAEEKTQTQKPKKKGNKLLLALGIATLVSNAIYAYARVSKGEFATSLAVKKFMKANADKVNNYINNPNAGFDVELAKEVDKIASAGKSKTGKFNLANYFEGLIEKLTKRDVEVDISKFQNELDAMMASKGSEEVAPIVALLKKHIGVLQNNGQTKFKIKADKGKGIPAALFNGLTKIFKTVYTLLSMPLRAANGIMEKCTGKHRQSFENLKFKLEQQDSSRCVSKYKKEIGKINELFDKENDKANKYQRLIQHFKSHTRNFEGGAETSDLANLSRTLVTLIASYFYVNDYRNSVLIESKGKNVERAKEMRNNSIWFKITNFIYNGTLMNLFNSLLKGKLNSSLLWATGIATGTEICNEYLIRKTIVRPMNKLDSRDAIIEYEQSRTNGNGIGARLRRGFKKMTGQKSLMEKFEAQQANKK